MDVQRHALTGLHGHRKEAEVSIGLRASDLPGPLSAANVMILASAVINLD
jgi:hypothetical protein